MIRCIIALVLLTSVAHGQNASIRTNNILSLSGSASPLAIQQTLPFRLTEYAKSGVNAYNLTGKEVRWELLDSRDSTQVRFGDATITTATNGYYTFATVFSGLEPGAYLLRVAAYDATTEALIAALSLHNITLTDYCGDCGSGIEIDLTANVTNDLAAPGAPDGYMPYVTNGGIAIGPAPAGGGSGTQTAQVNRIRINGTNYQGDLDWEPAGLLQLSPTGNTINAYVGEAEVFAGLQSYVTPLTNVSVSLPLSDYHSVICASTNTSWYTDGSTTYLVPTGAQRSAFYGYTNAINTGTWGYVMGTTGVGSVRAKIWSGNSSADPFTIWLFRNGTNYAPTFAGLLNGEQAVDTVSLTITSPEFEFYNDNPTNIWRLKITPQGVGLKTYYLRVDWKRKGDYKPGNVP